MEIMHIFMKCESDICSAEKQDKHLDFFLDQIDELVKLNVATFLGILGEKQDVIVIDAFEEVDNDPFVIDALGFGGEFGEEVGEGESFSGAVVGGEATLDRVGDGDSVEGDNGRRVRRLEKMRRA
ncbi:hypothetical protein VNO78_25832 [Psophocarpus tetragonolobus]|uniref:Uncharacterized protein n=1 Tax=Psophocarpus tetragonolobus TaxID=3891 RepID=A0AAN9XG56_PSOTE